MKIENTKAQMRKGILELCVLSIIAEKDAYPSDIIKQLESSQLIVKQGTMYPLLTRLKNDGILTYNWQESEMGPPRKYYQLTQKGGEFLQSLLETWNDLVATVNATTLHVTKKAKARTKVKKE
ncbi:MAG: PadR family transcriptional regulator [Bacteroidota bacterium]